MDHGTGAQSVDVVVAMPAIYHINIDRQHKVAHDGYGSYSFVKKKSTNSQQHEWCVNEPAILEAEQSFPDFGIVPDEGFFAVAVIEETTCKFFPVEQLRNDG